MAETSDNCTATDPITQVVHCKRAVYDIYIGRPSTWGNPYVIGRDGSREEVIRKCRLHVLSRPDLLRALPELRGKVLGCWCAPQPCHGDMLACLADRFGDVLPMLAERFGPALPSCAAQLAGALDDIVQRTVLCHSSAIASQEGTLRPGDRVELFGIMAILDGQGRLLPYLSDAPSSHGN